MPTPTTSLATLRPELAASLEEFDLLAESGGYIAHRVLPVVDVAEAAGTFGRIPLEQLLQENKTERSPGSSYFRGNWRFEPDSYTTVEHGFEEPVDDNEAEMYRNYFDAEVIAAIRAQHMVMKDAEKRVAELVFNPTVWTGSSLTTGITNEWDDYENATPINDVESAVRKVYEGSGLWPNALVINRLVFRNLRLCEQIIERIAAFGAGDKVRPEDITATQLAACFDLKYVIVAGGSKNLKAEGQSAQVSQIWSNEYAMVCRVAETSDFREPCIGRTFHWTGDGSEIDGRVESYREEQTRSEIIRVRHQTHEKILYKEAGHLLSNITT